MQVCSKLSNSITVPEELKDLLDEMAHFANKLLEMVPPLVSETIFDSPYCKEWHGKEMKPEWNENLIDYSLVYYRPILFFSYEGKVAHKGWVGNTGASDDSRKELDTAAGHVNDKPKYKKPCLKVRVSASSELLLSVPVNTSHHAMENPSEQEYEYLGGSEEESDKNTTSYDFGLKKF